MSKVVIEGELCSWTAGKPFATVMVKNPSYPSRPCSEDWAALSGRRVRVTVEAIEPEPVDRLAGCKCKECGGSLSVHESPFGTYYTVWCNHCRVLGNPQAKNPDAAIDAYLAAQKAEPSCPHCGGEIQGCHCEYKSATGELANLYEARCWRSCGAHGSGPTRQAALDALAEYLAPCPRCGGKAEYKSAWYVRFDDPNVYYWHWAVCSDRKCGIRSPQFDSKREVAAWWHKREAQHG